MKNSRKLLTTALAATMLVGALSVATPASAWSRWGGGGWGRHWGYGGGWARPGYWGSGAGLGLGVAGLATGLALGAAASAPVRLWLPWLLWRGHPGLLRRSCPCLWLRRLHVLVAASGPDLAR